MSENDRTARDYTIAWITALYEELVAATAVLDEIHEEPKGFKNHANDNNSYQWGSIRKHNIVLASLPDTQTGIAAAATTASQILSSLPWIKIGLMVGIGGGLPQPGRRDIRLGDVAVSRPSDTSGGVIQYDRGASIPRGRWEQRGILAPPPVVLLTALSSLRAFHGRMGTLSLAQILDQMIINYPHMNDPDDEPGYVYQGFENDRLFQPDYDHVGASHNLCSECDSNKQVPRKPRRTTTPKIHYGVIASGSSLIRDAARREDLLASTKEDCLCVETEAAGLKDNFPCIVIRGISDYADSHKDDRWKRYAAATAAAYAKELVRHIPVQNLEETSTAKEMMTQVQAALEEMNERASLIQEDMQRQHTATATETIDQTIRSLPTVAGAAYNSFVEASGPTCLGGTRVELLEEIMRWAEDPKSDTVFWLQGIAGEGKSTITRTLAAKLAQKGYLGASFFFKRDKADWSNLSKFFPTIASQLAKRYPSTAPFVKQAIDREANGSDIGLALQLERLILQPLQEAFANNETLSIVVILIDALDECNVTDHINTKVEVQVKAFIQLLVQAGKSGLKFFLTSRPEHHIKLGFRPYDGRYQDMALHHVSKDTIARDISFFLRHKIDSIRTEWNSIRGEGQALKENDWPSDEDFAALLTMSVPLFIFADTLCRFISERGSPQQQLEYLVNNGAGTQSSDSDLVRVYNPVLQRFVTSLAPKRRHQLGREFQEIVGSIAVLADPLSTSSLGNILGKHKHEIEGLLDHFHSVLDVPASSDDPVRFHHLSFREYLTDAEDDDKNGRDVNFIVDTQDTHRRLFHHCLKFMDKHLRKDICELEWPGIRRTEINAASIQRYIPPELGYASSYWIYHLQHNKAHIPEEEVLTFLKKRFLHWVEVLVLIGKVWTVKFLLKDLQSLFTFQGSAAADFVQDALYWIRDNAALLEDAPLQIYSSALVFSPRNSLVKKAFEKDVPDWLTITSNVKETWDNRDVQVLKASGYIGFKSITASRTLDFVAAKSSSCDGTQDCAHIWRVSNGELLHSEPVRGKAVVLSNDSSLLAAGHEDGVSVWKTETFMIPLHKLELGDTDGFHDFLPSQMEFSDDSTLLAATGISNDEKVGVVLWDVRSGQRKWDKMVKRFRWPLEGSPIHLSLSTDSNLVGLLCRTTPARLEVLVWQAHSGQLAQRSTYPYPFGMIAHSCCLSPDLKLLAYMCAAEENHRPEIHVRTVLSGELVTILRSNQGGLSDFDLQQPCLSFSEDSEYLTVSAVSKLHVLSWKDNMLQLSQPAARQGEYGTPGGAIQIWSVTRGGCLFQTTLPGVNACSVQIRLRPMSLPSILITSSGDDSILCWTIGLDQPNFPTECSSLDQAKSLMPDYQIETIALSPSSDMVALLYKKNAHQYWEIQLSQTNTESHMNQRRTFQVDNFFVGDKVGRVMKLSPDSCYITLSVLKLEFPANIITVWNTTTGRLVLFRYDVDCCGFSPNSMHIAIPDNRAISVYCLGTGNVIKRVNTASSTVKAVAVSSMGDAVAFAACPKLYLWHSGAEAPQTLSMSGRVTICSFSPNSKLLAVLAPEYVVKHIHIYETKHGALVFNIKFNIIFLGVDLGFMSSPTVDTDYILLTNLGAFNVAYDEIKTAELPLSRPKAAHIPWPSVYSCVRVWGTDQNWIYWKGRRLMYLPQEYWFRDPKVWRNVIAATSATSGLGLIKIAPDRLPSCEHIGVDEGMGFLS